jgi:hypothetical protein
VKCPVRIRYIGLFDTVASFGKPGNQINIGHHLDLPANVETARHAIAANEMRRLFPVTRLNEASEGQSFGERAFPGDHSDIGAGHGDDNNRLSEAPLQYIWSQGLSAGAPFGPLPERKWIDSRTPHDLSVDPANIVGLYLFGGTSTLWNPLHDRSEELSDLPQ